MSPEELSELIGQVEDLKLDFKREYKLSQIPPADTDRQEWNLFVKGQWDEFIKDILALAHGNVGTAQRSGYLIIGAADEILADGTRELHDTSYLQLTRQQILNKVNAACDPPLPNLYCEPVELNSKKLLVITIPPSPHVHETIRQLKTTKGQFDSTGRLRHYHSDKTYSSRSVFIRRGEDTDLATDQERQALRVERERLIKEHLILTPRLHNIIQSYIAGSYNEDLYAALDQAGETDPDRKTLLQRIFVDLSVQMHTHHRRNFLEFISQSKNRRFLVRSVVPATQFFLDDSYKKAVIIGGPGQGKSTLGQYLAQAHRAKFLDKPWEFVPHVLRIPFRVVLKNFAQWLTTKPDLDSLDAYLAYLVGKKTGSGSVSAEDIQTILNCYPCLLILDGLDEVFSPHVRDHMLEQIHSFFLRSEQLDFDLIILATSRPTGYSDEFDSEDFLHLELLPLNPEDAYHFAQKWVTAKRIQEDESEQILTTFKECQVDENIANLLRTPLQVNIILLIIKGGGRPPSQKEALFDQYWGTILRREKSKTKEVTQIIESDETLLLNLHAYLAYLLHSRAADENIQSLLPEEGFKQAIYDFLRQDDNLSSEETIQQKVELLLREARDRLVLIVEPMQGLFGFELRPIQEFFAAVYLIQTAKNTDERFKRLAEITRLEHWQNVALFFAGRVARSYEGESSLLLEGACRPVDREDASRYLRPGAWLALRISADGALGKKRNLQYSAIEYGLKILEISQTFEQEEELQSLLAQLPQRDQRDMLRPILEEKIRQLPTSLLVFALELYVEHFGITNLFKEKIDFLLQNSGKDTASMALNLAIRYKSEPDWMIERLRENWDWWEREFASLWAQSPDYIEKILRKLSLSKSKIIALATAVREPHMRRYPRLLSRKPRPLEEEQGTIILKANSPLDQLIAMLQCIKWFGHLDRIRNRHWNEQIAKNARIILISPRKLPETYIDTIKFIPELDEILQQDDLFPWLRLQIWRLYWYFHDPNSVNLKRFYEDIQVIGKIDNLPESFLNYAFRDSWPLLSLSILQKGENIEKWKPYLEMEKHTFVIDQIKSVIEKNHETSDSSSSEQLITALSTGLELSTFFPELAILAKQLEVNLKDLINIHCRIRMISPERQALTEQTVDELFAGLEKAKDDVDQLHNIIMFLANSTWKPTPDNLAQAKRLLEVLLIDLKVSTEISLIQSSLILILQILVYDNTCLDIMPHMLSALAQAETNKLHPWLIRDVLDNLTPESLAELQTFLSHTDKVVQTGALVFWKYIIDAAFVRRSLKDEFEKIREIRFDPLFGLSLAEDQNEERSLGGIALLTLSDYPVHDQEYRQTLLTLIQESTNTSKENAWVRFLREALIQNKNKEGWSIMLQDILDEPAYYSRNILRAAKVRYQKISSKRIEAKFYL